MAKKQDAYIENAGIVIDKNISDTLEENYMPYVMSVIVSRALPEIDGFKPSHRKILYTMYKMGLLTGARTKSANIVGQTMRLNPHGDSAIYETMVRLSKGNESLLHAYVDSKGNFGKAYSKNMAFAASRYTEAKLADICTQVFTDIDKDTVDFIPNYDNTITEPTLLPVKFPSILVNSNIGIAVGMASSICPFNLSEVCETAISLMKDPNHDIISTLKAPDFPGGGFIMYDENELRRIYETGKGSVKVRARYNYDKTANCVEITEIPPTTTVEAIMDKIIELVKAGKIKDLSDVRDETDISGLKLTLDLKRGVDADVLMQKLYRLTPLQDSYACNFNVLISGYPKVMGVKEILDEWTGFRIECIKRRVFFDLNKKKEKLHLLRGLDKILLDIDKAVKIVRETESETDVVPNLMIGFGIDEIQAEYVAEIKLRHLNAEYILKRTQEISNLETEIADLQTTLDDKKRINAIIISELKDVIKKYGQPRKSMLSYASDVMPEIEDDIPDYPVNVFFTKEGYFKKITPQSLRMSGEHKLKDGDEIMVSYETTNKAELIFFTDKYQAYKARCSDFNDAKASVMGDYIPAGLSFDNGENAVYMICVNDFNDYLMLFFENGKCAKVPLTSFETKTKRKKLANAYYSGSKLVAMYMIKDDAEFILQTTAGKALIFRAAMILPKSTRDTQGVQVMRITKGCLDSVKIYTEGCLENPDYYRTKTIPVAGVLMKDNINQMEL